MNTTYRAVFNESLGTWVAVSEIAKSHGKRSSVRKAVVATAVAAALLAMQATGMAQEIGAEAAWAEQPVATQELGEVGPGTPDAAVCEPQLDADGMPIADTCEENSGSSDHRALIGSGIVAGAAGLAALFSGSGSSHGDKAAPVAPAAPADSVAPVAPATPEIPAELPASLEHSAENLAVADGATGLRLDEDNTVLVLNGHTAVAGEGSTGTDIHGNGASVVIGGETTVSAGGTGVRIDGDAGSVSLEGTTAVSGPASTGVDMTGDSARVSLGGTDDTTPTTVTVEGGGTAVRISGNDADVQASNIDATSTGAGSSLFSITGDDASANLSGTLTVRDGARGVDITGSRATVQSAAKIDVADAGSIGIRVAAENPAEGDFTRFTNTGDIQVSKNATGAGISGSQADVTLGGNINVTVARNAEGVLQGGQGVVVEGDHGKVRINGNVTVANEDIGTDATQMSASSVTRGVSVSGNDNQVSVDGAINIAATGQITGSGQSQQWSGLQVTGDNNTVNVDGGVMVRLEASDANKNHMTPTGIAVNGKSSVTVSGQSAIQNLSLRGQDSKFATVQGGGSLKMTDASVLDIDHVANAHYSYNDGGVLAAAGAGSTIANAGAIRASGDFTVLMAASSGARLQNSGTHSATNSRSSNNHSAAMQLVRGAGSTADNSGEIRMTSSATPRSTNGVNIYPLRWAGDAGYAQLANNYGTVTNGANGSIVLEGAALFGPSASANGTALNAGQVSLNGAVAVVDAQGQITGHTPYTTTTSYYRGAGMLAGSTDAPYGENARATNTGTISVKNSGFGMLALSGGTTVNTGTINLDADAATVADGTAHQLIGLGALAGGTAINEQGGVINVNTDLGRAFYTEGNGLVVNHGSVNFNGAAMDPSDAHRGAAPTMAEVLTDVIAGTGQSVSLDDPLGYVAANHLTNYGAVTNAATLDMRGKWLLNQQGASFSSPSNSLALGSFENKGTLAAGAVRSGTGYNRAGATMNVELLTLASNATFFNEGNFHGSATAASYTNNIVNTGDWTVSAGNAIQGRLNVTNQQGGTLRNTAPGTGALVNISSLPGGQPFNNAGTITATDGYAALKTAHGDATDRPNNWLVNRSTGVINGVMNGAEKALISMGRATNFGNEGTINVQGNGAVGILGAASSYTTNIINAGTLNVGTEAGKADGTNGTGLIGIKGSNTANEITNNATGVINVYADDSYAFGGNGKVVNNGTVNLACDTGCAIFAPGSAAAITGADKVIATQEKLPGQGSVPTPAPEVAPRMLLRGYQVGTNANGTAGTLRGNHLDVSEVKVDTAFAAGTAAKAVTFDNVFQGTDITGAQNIQSDSAVWTANAAQDAKGIDVTMTKNAYQDVVTDAKLKDAAAALEGAYSNNAVFQSLNLATAAEVTKGVSQLTGQGFGQAMNQAKVLSNRFSVLADNVKETPSGLGFNMVTRGTPGARLAGSEYDMAVLSSRFSVGDQGKVAVRYGVANLASIDAGSNAAASNGLSGVSQFAGVQYVNPIAAGLELSGDLQFEQHRLESSRSLNYGSVNETASSKNGQDKYRANFVVGKPVEVAKGFTVTPMMGLDMRQTRDHAVNEQGAGAYNLNVSGATTTAMDAIGGVKLGYQHANGLNASVRLQGGPNLFYGAGQRQASLAGAPDARFALPDATQRSRFNYNSTVSVGYAKDLLNLSANGYTADQDGVKDYGVMFKVVKQF